MHKLHHPGIHSPGKFNEQSIHESHLSATHSGEKIKYHLPHIDYPHHVDATHIA